MYYCIEKYREDLNKCMQSIGVKDEMNGKSILVTGATGLIGSFLVDELLYLNEICNCEITVYAMARSKERLEKRFVSHLRNAKLHMVVGDVVEPLQLSCDLDYIVHAAGDGYPAAFSERPFETMTPALIGTVNLLQYAYKHKAQRFLYVSSGEVYGKRIGDRRPFFEEEAGSFDSMNVRSCYPNAKKSAETLCASFFAEYGLECVVARLSHTYGPCFTINDNRATTQFAKQAVSGNDIAMYSKGTQLRSYTYVADAVAGIMCVLLQGIAGEAYNVSNMHASITIAEFAETLAEIANISVKYSLPDESEIKQLTPIEYAVLDCTKLEGVGWKPGYCADEGIRQMYAIMKEI